MKYTIADVQQHKLIEFGLDIKDAFILSYLKDIIGAKNIIKKTVNDETFYWVKYDDLIAYLPILEINNVKVLGRRISKYEELGLLKRHIHKKYNKQLGRVSEGYTFLKIEEKFKELFEIDKIKDDIEEINEKAKEMGIVTEGTEKFLQSESEVLKSDHMCGYSKVPSYEDTEKCPQKNTTNNNTPNKNTTTTKEQFSSSPLSFLEKEDYKELHKATKKNIIKNFPNLQEEKFKQIYNLAILEFKQGLAHNFNAVLYKGLSQEWAYRGEEVRQKKLKLTPVSKYKEPNFCDKDTQLYKDNILKNLDEDPTKQHGWKSNCRFEIEKLKTIPEINEFLGKYKLQSYIQI